MSNVRSSSVIFTTSAELFSQVKNVQTFGILLRVLYVNLWTLFSTMCNESKWQLLHYAYDI